MFCQKRQDAKLMRRAEKRLACFIKTGNQNQQREQGASLALAYARLALSVRFYASRRAVYFYPKGKSAKQNTRANTIVPTGRA